MPANPVDIGSKHSMHVPKAHRGPISCDTPPYDESYSTARWHIHNDVSQHKELSAKPYGACLCASRNEYGDSYDESEDDFCKRQHGHDKVTASATRPGTSGSRMSLKPLYCTHATREMSTSCAWSATMVRALWLTSSR